MLVATVTVDDLRPVTLGATWVAALAATVVTAMHGLGWWRRRRSGDPLVGWLLAGTVIAWLAVVPRGLELAEWRLPGRDVVWALLFAATVPLLVGGAVVDAIRDVPSRYHGVSHRVVEWTVLAGGIVVVYTGIVAGLGSLVGGSGPTWFLVATTGAIALGLEPARQHVRRLVDRFVYGARDDPLAVVQRVVDHLGADSGDRLLPNLVESLRRELRLDAVAIDLRMVDGWQRAAETGPPTTYRRVVMLHHRDDVVGRIVVGWEDGPSLRQRDEEVLGQLVGPLSLAVGWVRADDRPAPIEPGHRVGPRGGAPPAATRPPRRARPGADRRLARAAHVAPPARPVRRRGRGGAVQRPARPRRRRGRRRRRRAQADRARPAADGARPARPGRRRRRVHPHVRRRRWRSTSRSPPAPFALPAAVEVATYRIVTEAVTNVVRHAGAGRCWLTIAAGPTVEIDVVDDGIGIGRRRDGRRRADGDARTGRRARRIDVAAPNHEPCGTHVHVRLPAALP